MKKIALTGMDPLSYGDQAAIVGTISTLRTLMPDASLTMFSPLPKESRVLCESYGVEIIKMPWAIRPRSTRFKTIANLYSGLLALFTLANCVLFRIFKSLKLSIPVRGGLQHHDLFIELGADIHARYFGTLAFFYSLFFPLYCVMLKKPFVMYAETMGPYEGKLERLLMRYICNRASLVTLREAASLKYLQSLELDNSNVHVTADPAFLFTSQCSEERVNEILSDEGISRNDQPLIGVAPSALIYRYAFPDARNKLEKRRRYVALTAGLTDYLMEELDAKVILISHHAESSEYSDTPLCREIRQAVKNKQSVGLISGSYTVDEMKAVIGVCQMVVTCKMHVAIAASSLYIPTVTMAFSHKYDVLSPVLEQGKYVIDIRNADAARLFSELCSRIDHVWANREEIARTLKDRIPEVREKAELSARLIKELVDSPRT